MESNKIKKIKIFTKSEVGEGDEIHLGQGVCHIEVLLVEGQGLRGHLAVGWAVGYFEREWG